MTHKPKSKPFNRCPAVGDRAIGEFVHSFSVPQFVDPKGFDVVSAVQVGHCREVDDNLDGLAFCYFNADYENGESWSAVLIWDFQKQYWTRSSVEMELITEDFNHGNP